MLLEADRPWGWSDVFQPGFRHPGGIVAVIAVFPLLRRRLLPRTPIGLVADCAAISATCALAMVRLGCFAAGCCFGTVSNLPWAVRFPIGSLAANLHSSMGWLAPGATASLPVHPLQLYFAVLAAGVGAFLVWFRRRRAYDGQLFLLFLAIHEIGKYLLEFLRAPGITPTGSHVQAFSLFLGVSGATALLAVALARGTPPLAGRLYGGRRSSVGPRPSDATT
jgi:phosphatidylglycerol:prolipoprotein diacylglycerol transferase